MSDIREHHALAQCVRNRTVCMQHAELSLCSPEREQAQEMVAPITYCTLQRCHLAQVHDLLGRAFWEGIDGMLICPVQLCTPVIIRLRRQSATLSTTLLRGVLSSQPTGNSS